MTMSEKHLASAITRRLKNLSRKERIAKIKRLASASTEDEKFVRETFPDLYREALLSPGRAAGARSGLARRRARSEERR
jgi:hypothetical protein